MSEDIDPAGGVTPAGGVAKDSAGAGSGIRWPSQTQYPPPASSAPDLGEGGAALDDTSPSPATSDQFGADALSLEKDQPGIGADAGSGGE